MPRIKRVPPTEIEHVSPAMSVEDRYDQLINLAVSLAEERLRDKSASNQLVAEIIRYGSIKERLQREKLEKETAVLNAKVGLFESTARTQDAVEAAMKALKHYRGEDSEEEEEYEY